MGYGVGQGKDRNKSYVIRTVMHVGRFDAWTGSVGRTVNAEVARSRQEKTLLSTLCKRYLRSAVAGILKVV